MYASGKAMNVLCVSWGTHNGSTTVVQNKLNADLLIPLAESVLHFTTCGDFFIPANLQILHR